MIAFFVKTLISQHQAAKTMIDCLVPHSIGRLPVLMGQNGTDRVGFAFSALKLGLDKSYRVCRNRK
jgi:hypothetical protein